MVSADSAGAARGLMPSLYARVQDLIILRHRVIASSQNLFLKKIAIRARNSGVSHVAMRRGSTYSRKPRASAEHSMMTLHRQAKIRQEGHDWAYPAMYFHRQARLVSL